MTVALLVAAQELYQAWVIPFINRQLLERLYFSLPIAVCILGIVRLEDIRVNWTSALRLSLSLHQLKDLGLVEARHDSYHRDIRHWA